MAMAIVWGAMVMASVVCGMAGGRMAQVSAAALEGARAAVELLARAHLTEATAWLLDWGGRAGVLAQTAGADALDAEFSL